MYTYVLALINVSKYKYRLNSKSGIPLDLSGIFRLLGAERGTTVLELIFIGEKMINFRSKKRWNESMIVNLDGNVGMIYSLGEFPFFSDKIFVF